jgi:hypothetical protein
MRGTPSVFYYCLGIRSERRLCEEEHLNLGSTGWASMAAFPTTPRSQRTGMAASVRVIFFGISSRLRFAAVLKKPLLVARALPWTAA